MGKKPAAKAAAEKPAAQTATSAGDRPPRPSHGHKWDDEKKEWVGKGSLDERKAAKLKETGPKEMDDGTILKSHQSMPTTLLFEWTKREKREKPWYSKARSWDASKFRQKVTLTDPKNKDASLEFTPYDDSDSMFVAKEHAALLALLAVQGSLPLERKLPDPYCGIWKASIAETKQTEPKSKAKAKAKAQVEPKAAEASAEKDNEDAATFAPPLRAASQYTSKAERDSATKKRIEDKNKRDAMREMKRRIDMPAPILLSKKMRARLHQALGLHEAYEAAGISAEVEIGDVEAEALAQCVDWGFAADDVMRAVAAIREEDAETPYTCSRELAENLRKWLCLHLPEEELPEEFAAGQGQFSSHIGVNGKAQQKQHKQAVALSPIALFDEARTNLLAWLHAELNSYLRPSDADALHASAEAVLLGIEASSVDDADLEEAGENVAIILSSESDALDATGQELQRRLRAAWKLRKADAGVDKDDEVNVGEDADADMEGTGVGEDVISELSEVNSGGCWENGAQERQDDAAGGKKSRDGRCARKPAIWFGSAAYTSQAAAAETAWAKSSGGQRMRSHRETLPAARSRDELMGLCQANPIVLVQGETGCGKTTQVGQFLLEADPTARVVVTQPRRVAATSVAHRVAEERGERLGEGTVGYSVRGESKIQRQNCRLLFCTNGVLIRRLLGEPLSMFSEETCTHVLIDEVHERSVEIDLLLTLLHHLLPKRPKLQVILMSATMDVKLLVKMFLGKPPVTKIPGRTFPVSQLFIEDVEKQTDACTWGGSQYSSNGGQKFLQPLNFGSIAELALLVLRRKLREAPDDGAVLIFVPGVGEIDRVARELQQRADKGEAFVLPLHGGLPPDQQRRCFEFPARGGPRKIVVSTNVAETSVTVPDVTIVIDTARERRLQLDPGAVAPCLAECVCAKSSLTQRRGRAGRVRAGICVTLMLRSEYENLPMEAPPEIESTALESLCLQVRVAGFEPEAFLAKMPTPPRPERVVDAEHMLKRIGATRPRPEDAEAAEETALGRHLAALPCDVHTGKLLVLGAFLGVVSMALDVAAMLSVRSPLKNVAKDPKAQAWRERLRQSLRPGGTKSDHCLYARLLQLWSNAQGSARRELCQDAALVWERMSEAASVRSQLVVALRGLGFDARTGDDHCAGEWRALRAAVSAAFYPQLARVQRPPPEFAEGFSGAVEKQAEARRLRYFVNVSVAGDLSRQQSEGGKGGRQDMRGFLHPASVLFKETSYSCPFVVFSSKQLQQTQGDYSTRLNLSDASEASIFALLLFGGRLEVDHRSNTVMVDNWITLSGGSTTVVALVEQLRKEIDKLLLKKATEPWFRLADVAACQAVSVLLSTDGLG